MASGLKNLTQHILGDSRVQSSNIQRSFVWLGSSTARHIARLAASRRHWATRQGRADGGWDGIVVLRDDYRSKRRRRHMLLRVALVSIITRSARGRRRQSSAGVLLVGHGCRGEMRTANESQESGR